MNSHEATEREAQTPYKVPPISGETQTHTMAT